ncbi:aflatoxin biosynthesis ketoreductase Nor-1 [Colletotrichum tofieldiae]|uniref:Aflatoxin biosynthesis ketoreductase Nor-1 (Short-chain dehydrogenase) n=1 Tax=Colletotrichum tofieldiae TaxID=708197 RepID=A0A166SQH7_9PEZI|nr:aflatoxin biosynthesis ketoreductase Nor-1 (short-chain dehydrogenase) [Colletotrichum tofieldiae]GKT60002.1 aflatoxin biosynthesis ketoreductase Nor-1 [Colletotrichum tofieldiae]GKT67720.1 aflatoxin biosynthesis ketoreductase Nor-1 [Colletotrichum tofieldiae]GKT91321.1 aflatoxin biosynthesis ketoreductase Nor-1 [Colletotrichum tofieldiae]
MSSGLTYLITGANRGIGQGFASLLLQRPSTTVVAGVRDPSNPSSKALADLPKGEGSKLILVKIDSAVESDPASAIATLQKEHNITSLDVVIANAGISHTSAAVSNVDTKSALDHFAINSVAPLILFNAAAPLLKASASKNPIFVGISSLIGSKGAAEAVAQIPASASPYGASKAALNWFVRRLHFEEPWLTAFVFHPGLVETDMAAALAEKTGADLKAFGSITVKQSVDGMVAAIDKANRESSGTFKNYDGTDLPW